MALISVQQLHAIKQIIADYHNAFVVNLIGPDAVSPDTLKALKDKGLVGIAMSITDDAYLFGKHSANNEGLANFSPRELQDYFKKNPLPLSPIEQRAIQMAKHQAAQYAIGLGNRVDTTTGQILIEADANLRSKLRTEIRDATAENVAKRESVRKLKSDLGWATKDWARDWDRIAITETQNAMQRGMADHLAENYGADVRVAKIVAGDACEYCKRLYLGPDGNPRIFKLSELEGNGTNFKKKANEWLPIVEATHPNCMCQLIMVPDGWGFDEDGELTPF